ncbi:MAG TPA: enoyl-CoA hydratase [Pseudogracilibacillus sp.]|nr:enoyl-CoA hydratase [Pseudogracilibacillus sp.]
MEEPILFELQDKHIGVIRLNRPEVMNSFSMSLLEEWNRILDELEARQDIRVVIITANGQKAFSAGADLKERKQMTDAQVTSTVALIGKTIQRIAELPVPVIAAMNGAAIGGGMELALACDIRIAAENSKMGLTETSLAIIPGAGGTQRLARLIGSGQAKRLIFTAQLVGTEEAKRLGIVEETAKSENLFNKAMDMAGNIAENGPIAIRRAKQAINDGIETDIHTGLSIENLCYQETIQTKDREEGLQAFRDKRKPNYQGK